MIKKSSTQFSLLTLGITVFLVCLLFYAFPTAINSNSTFSYEQTSSNDCDSNRVSFTISYTPSYFAADDEYSTNEDMVLIVDAPGVLENDASMDSTASLGSEPTHGTVELQADGAFTYYPDSDWYGIDSFTYYLTLESVVVSDEATVTIEVIAVNDPPVAVDDNYEVGKGSILNVEAPGVLSNDYDAENDALRFYVVKWPSNGSVEISRDGGFVYAPDTGFCGTDNFTYRVYESATELEGNIATVYIDVLDTEAPTSSYTLDRPPDQNGWYSSSVTVTLTASDSCSGVDAIYYSLDDETWLEYSEPFPLSAEGYNTVFYYAIDIAGNVESSHVFTIALDSVAPSTTVTLEGDVGTDFCYRSDVSVTLSSFDQHSETANIEYSFDSETWYIYTGKVTLEGEGEFIFYYRAYDFAGNQEDMHTQWLCIDKTPPETSLTSSIVSGVGMVVTLDATDTLSGVNYINYSFDGTNWLTYTEPFVLETGPIATVFFYATDNAGNIEGIKSVTIEVDVTPPETTVSLEGSLGLEDWYVSDVNVSLTAIDDFSDSVTTVYSFDGNTWIAYTGKILISEEGITTVYFNSTDSFGNVESTKSIDIKIDKTAPETYLTICPEPIGGDPVYVSSTSQFSLVATDNPSGSGLDRIEYRIDSGDWVLYQNTFYLPEIDSHILYYRSFDIAGNEEVMKSLSVIVNASSLSYTGQTSGVYSDPVFLEAVLIDFATQLPLEGNMITFTLAGKTVSSITDSNGVANATMIMNSPEGAYILSVVFTGDSTHTASSNSSDFTVWKEDAMLQYTGYTVISAELESFLLRATVFDDPDGYLGDLTRINVTFTICLVGTQPSEAIQVLGPYAVELTDIPGIGVVALEVATLPAGEYYVVTSLNASTNIYYKSVATSQDIIIVDPTRDFVTGGGWVWDSSGGKGIFAFVVKYHKKGHLIGNALYLYREGDWWYGIKSDSWIGLAIDENHAYFEGIGAMGRVNIETEEFECLGREFLFRIDIVDSKKDDLFQICIYDDNGLVFHKASSEPYVSVFRGNIRIHTHKVWSHCICNKGKKSGMNKYQKP